MRSAKIAWTPKREKINKKKLKASRSPAEALPCRGAHPPVSQSGWGAWKGRADSPPGHAHTRPPTTAQQPCGARPPQPSRRRRRRGKTRSRHGAARKSQHARPPRQGVDRGRPKPHRIACAHAPWRGSSHFRALADCRTGLYDTERGGSGSRGRGSLCHTESRSVQGSGAETTLGTVCSANGYRH